MNGDPRALGLGAKQELFARLLAEFIAWVFAQGWAVRLGEARVYHLGPDGRGRKGISIATGKPVRTRDAVHMAKSLHYEGLAADLNLFVDGDYIESTEHPAWKACGEKWESMHELARWGGRFSDANHISIEHEGRR